ncbi:hypothetical protein BDV35DRAFT_359930 [Aspergillus flavus]|uniref:Uncharacterized protein n=1 Tax=Aspergillus flavus TaxID=5059 RepID=A0A5N6GVD4_ASPFL|nr:hypothetical protein BDV35DRAFT_359930 [Aspergillus flavus]
MAFNLTLLQLAGRTVSGEDDLSLSLYRPAALVLHLFYPRIIFGRSSSPLPRLSSASAFHTLCLCPIGWQEDAGICSPRIYPPGRSCPIAH